MANTFIRVHAYGGKSAHAVIGEMCREPEFSAHVAAPQATDPETAKMLREAIKDYMAEPERYVDHEGREIERKRRHDAKCLIAGVASHPTPIKKLKRDDGLDWRADLKKHLAREWPGQRIIMKTHIDEGFLHVHFAIVGDANQLHPGLRAEREGGKRKAGKRSTDYRAGTSAFVDRYHEAVAAPRGWARKTEKITPWRIKDRAVREQVLDLQARIKDLEHAATKAQDLKLQTQIVQAQAALGSVWASAKKEHFARPATNAGARFR